VGSFAMSKESEMDEIFLHIKQLINNQKKTEDDNDETMEESITIPETLSDQTEESREDTS